jgi:KDO2-lipid IV(A) lauroyltransferase
MAALLLRLLGRIVCALPVAAALRLGELLGAFWFRVLRIRRGTAIRQIRRAFPAWSAAEARETARRFFRNLGRWAVEFLRLVGPAKTRAEVLGRVALDGVEAYDEAVARGGGAIVVTAHLGNWDLAACTQALAGRKLTLLSRKLSNRGLDRYWMERRRALGLTIIDERSRLDELARIVREGGTLVLIVDQATPGDLGGVQLDFLGRPAWTTRLPALLALRTGAPIFPVFVDSSADRRHVIRVEAPLVPPPGPVSVGERALALTREINDRLERRIRTCPDQWLWLHRRWKEFPSSPRRDESTDASPPDQPLPPNSASNSRSSSSSRSTPG